MIVLTIVGARPQFIKAGVVSKAIEQTPGIREVLVHTGQHFDENMSEIFFEQLEIPRPDHLLDIRGGTHGDMTGRMLIELEKVMLTEQPDRVLVYGDTNSTLAGALAAAKLHIPVAHVEAGLRSFDKEMPEEINRVLTDHLSDILFCPTDQASQNLIKEGISQPMRHVVNVGDVMLDSARYFAQAATRPASFPDVLMTKVQRSLMPGSQECMDTLSGAGNFILATLHRAENTDRQDRLQSLVHGLNEVHKTIAPVVMPLHPRTCAALGKHGMALDVYVIEPVGYMEMLWLLRHCGLVITDSGGLQKEAFFFNRFCVTMREQTEWVELVENGVNVLVGSDDKALVANSTQKFGQDVAAIDGLYGNGDAAVKIASFLAQKFDV